MVRAFPAPVFATPGPFSVTLAIHTPKRGGEVMGIKIPQTSALGG